MNMNMNSLIIYTAALALLMAGLLQDDLSGFFGIIAGGAIIYFLLANDEQRENIRKNLTWRKK